MPEAVKKSQAFLLRRVRHGEADLVLTLLTRECGKISCMARHALRSQRRFGSALQPFCTFEALWRPRGQAMAFLESALPLRAWPGLISDLERMGAAWRLVELVDALEEPGSVHVELFTALEAAFQALSVSQLPVAAALLAEARLLDLAGWAPRLDACVSCRSPFPFDGARLSLAEGGLLCSACRTQGTCLALRPTAVEALQALFAGRAGAHWMEGRQPLRRFVEYQLGKALKTETFERQIREGL